MRRRKMSPRFAPCPASTSTRSRWDQRRPRPLTPPAGHAARVGGESGRRSRRVIFPGARRVVGGSGLAGAGSARYFGRTSVDIRSLVAMLHSSTVTWRRAIQWWNLSEVHFPTSAPALGASGRLGEREETKNTAGRRAAAATAHVRLLVTSPLRSLCLLPFPAVSPLPPAAPLPLPFLCLIRTRTDGLRSPWRRSTRRTRRSSRCCSTPGRT